MQVRLVVDVKKTFGHFYPIIRSFSSHPDTLFSDVIIFGRQYLYDSIQQKGSLEITNLKGETTQLTASEVLPRFRCSDPATDDLKDTDLIIISVKCHATQHVAQHLQRLQLKSGGCISVKCFHTFQ